MAETPAAVAPAVSVVVPTYNRADTLERAVRSVLAQTFTDLEVVVVDDGSTDATKEVVRGLDDPRVRYLHQENAGRCAARNRGAAVARGHWLSFLDSDDAALPDWLESLVAAAESTGDRGGGPADGASCGFRAVLEDGEGGYREHGQRLPSDLGPVYGHAVALFTAGTFLLRRELFHRIGGYAEELAFAENSELALRLTATGPRLVPIPRPLVLYTLRPRGHRPAAGGARARLEGARYILHHHGERYLRSAPQSYANYCAIAGVNAARLGRLAEARAFFLDAVRATPLDPRQALRLLLTLVPPLARRLWTGREGETVLEAGR